MKKLLTVAATLFCVLGFAQQKLNTLSAQEKKDGWKLLFDGKTTTGWHAFNKTAVGASWKVDDGALCLDTTKAGGNLVTKKPYSNFDFKYEWKISKNGNSGVMFYVQEGAKYDEPYVTGPEMQVLDNDGHPDGKITKHRAGDLYDLIKCSKETVKPTGEWNQAEIICNNGKLSFLLNGENVVSTTMWDDNWKQMVAASKFKDMPDFAKFKTGKIALQDHGNAVCFRNLKIKEL